MTNTQNNKVKDFSKHVYGYFYRSTNSIGHVSEEIEKFCKDNNLKLDKIYYDLDCSRQDLDRPAFTELLLKNKNKDIIMYSIAHVSYDVEYVLTYAKIMEDISRKVYFIKEGFTLDEFLRTTELSRGYYVPKPIMEKNEKYYKLSDNRYLGFLDKSVKDISTTTYDDNLREAIKDKKLEKDIEM